MTPSIDLSAALAQRFDTYALDTSPGIVIELFGPPGAGKTDFALRAPAPVLHFGFDYHGARRPAGRLLRDFPEQMKHVHTRVYPMKPRDRKAEPDDVAQEQMRREVLLPFLEDYEFGLKHARTLVIDTFDMLRETQVIARFGKLEQNSQTAYQEINAETARILHQAREAEKVLILVSRMKEEYKEIVDKKGNLVSKSTGKLIPASNARAQHSVDARLEVLDGFKVKVYDAKTNKRANGEVRESPSFADIAMMLKPDVDPERWL